MKYDRNACNYVTTVDKILLDNVGIFHNEKEKEVELFSLEIKIKTLSRNRFHAYKYKINFKFLIWKMDKNCTIYISLLI